MWTAVSVVIIGAIHQTNRDPSNATHFRSLPEAVVEGSIYEDIDIYMCKKLLDLPKRDYFAWPKFIILSQVSLVAELLNW